MNKREPYSYVLLQYRHDAFACELVNVGILLFAPDTGRLLIKVRSSMGRISKLYRDLNRRAFLTSLKVIERAARSLTRDAAGLYGHAASVLDFANRIIPEGEGAFLWGALRSGASRDLDRTVDEMYDRYVALHDVKYRGHRDDNAVWKLANEILIERDLDRHLEAKVIESSVDSIEFQHAWKNGAWHCFQALSFDYETSDAILDKARRWVGQLTVLEDAQERFTPYFLLGAPSREDFSSYYEHAISILQKSRVQICIYHEHQAEELVNMIEDQINAHEEHVRNIAIPAVLKLNH